MNRSKTEPRIYLVSTYIVSDGALLTQEVFKNEEDAIERFQSLVEAETSSLKKFVIEGYVVPIEQAEDSYPASKIDKSRRILYKNWRVWNLNKEEGDNHG